MKIFKTRVRSLVFLGGRERKEFEKSSRDNKQLLVQVELQYLKQLLKQRKIQSFVSLPHFYTKQHPSIIQYQFLNS